MTKQHATIISTEQIARACGCVEEFELRDPDPWRKERLVKFRTGRCKACGKKANDENNAAQGGGTQGHGKRVKKGQEPKLLPAGTQIVLTRQEDGSWVGVLVASSVKVQGRSAGLMGLGSSLARKWLKETGARVTGKV